ncbi:unnamed protein product [Tuber melanosporum]|uniref:(Perigord truffle) hypothetical protein n=1 Tax=Tuber melanosporum (strain Mel28) TaxID=656061 RepID=D5G589_TUBMM|nr:uncharacterized protein GSTUM_00004220001 [Tuber melanosporum]CAZ79682.1 unnamed protein product [Tuber melanosporum]
MNIKPRLSSIPIFRTPNPGRPTPPTLSTPSLAWNTGTKSSRTQHPAVQQRKSQKIGAQRPFGTSPGGMARGLSRTRSVAFPTHQGGWDPSDVM